MSHSLQSSISILWASSKTSPCNPALPFYQLAKCCSSCCSATRSSRCFLLWSFAKAGGKLIFPVTPLTTSSAACLLLWGFVLCSRSSTLLVLSVAAFLLLLLLRTSSFCGVPVQCRPPHGVILGLLLHLHPQSAETSWSLCFAGANGLVRS